MNGNLINGNKDMRLLQIIWCATLVLVFIIGCLWYGGSGRPIGIEEGNALLEKVRIAHNNPEVVPGSFIFNMAEMIPNDDGNEFYAVNLENLKEGEAARQADLAYTTVVIPLLLKRAAHPVFVSNRAGLMLGEYGGQVDRVAVIRYRSLKDLIEMTLEPSMVAHGDQKFLSLDHTEVFITRPSVTFVTVRWMFGLILLLLAIAGWKIIELVSLKR